MRERQTRQKRAIYGALKALDHPTATEVYGYVRERDSDVSRATVFRVLGGFAASGKALELRMAGSDVRYDDRVDRHCHVHCRGCGKVADVEIAEFPDCGALVCDNGFSLDGVNVEFFGYCPECRKKSGSEEPSAGGKSS